MSESQDKDRHARASDVCVLFCILTPRAYASTCLISITYSTSLCPPNLLRKKEAFLLSLPDVAVLALAHDRVLRNKSWEPPWEALRIVLGVSFFHLLGSVSQKCSSILN